MGKTAGAVNTAINTAAVKENTKTFSKSTQDELAKVAETLPQLVVKQPPVSKEELKLIENQQKIDKELQDAQIKLAEQQLKNQQELALAQLKAGSSTPMPVAAAVPDTGTPLTAPKPKKKTVKKKKKAKKKPVKKKPKKKPAKKKTAKKKTSIKKKKKK